MAGPPLHVTPRAVLRCSLRWAARGATNGAKNCQGLGETRCLSKVMQVSKESLQATRMVVLMAKNVSFQATLSPKSLKSLSQKFLLRQWRSKSPKNTSRKWMISLRHRAGIPDSVAAMASQMSIQLFVAVSRRRCRYDCLSHVSPQATLSPKWPSFHDRPRGGLPNGGFPPY